MQTQEERLRNDMASVIHNDTKVDWAAISVVCNSIFGTRNRKSLMRYISLLELEKDKGKKIYTRQMMEDKIEGLTEENERFTEDGERMRKALERIIGMMSRGCNNPNTCCHEISNVANEALGKE